MPKQENEEKTTKRKLKPSKKDITKRTKTKFLHGVEHTWKNGEKIIQKNVDGTPQIEEQRMPNVYL